MSDVWADVFFIVVMWILGGLVIFQALFRKKEGNRLWKVYNEVSHKLGLTVKETASAGYGFPDVVGKIKGRSVLIHPIVGKGSGGVAKTAFIAEHRIRFNGKIMISLMATSSLLIGKYRYPLNIFNLKAKTNAYLVTSDTKANEKILNKLFSANSSDHFDSMVSKNKKYFLSLYLESGVAIFYTFDWEKQKEVLKNNLLDLVELMELLERDASILDSRISNQLLQYSTKKGLSKTIDMGLSIFVTILGAFVVGLGFITITDTSNMIAVLNIGAIIILIGTTRIYAATRMKSYSQENPLNIK